MRACWLASTTTPGRVGWLIWTGWGWDTALDAWSDGHDLQLHVVNGVGIDPWIRIRYSNALIGKGTMMMRKRRKGKAS